MNLLKQIAANMPHQWQTGLKRIFFNRQIKKGKFESDEPEYKILDTLIKPGDWVLDIGANVGHYTKRFSELVGSDGRVIAFEPVPTTLSLLAANSQLFRYSNVTLINAAVSDKLDVAGMDMPQFESGLSNYYRAHLSTSRDTDFSVLTISVDSLGITQPVTLIKIDAEGHEEFVISGMKQLIAQHHPVMIIETADEDFIKAINELGYSSQRLTDSPNTLFTPRK